MGTWDSLSFLTLSCITFGIVFRYVVVVVVVVVVVLVVLVVVVVVVVVVVLVVVVVVVVVVGRGHFLVEKSYY